MTEKIYICFMTNQELFTERSKRCVELKSLRESNGLTKVQVHKMTGLSRVTIENMETGTSGWNIDCEIIYRSFLLSFKKK